MRACGLIGCAMLAGALAACSPAELQAKSFGAMSHDEHLRCAAQINGYERLMSGGQVEREPEFLSKALAASMTHLTAYAVPQDIAERDAFAALNQLREELLGKEKPAALREAALACIEAFEKSGI